MLRTRLVGANTHNLKGVSLTLEPGEVVAITGVSGAGKSSLALDTLYAEGQRRFVESFSPYARQFLERLERPPMESLEPVPAAVAVDRAAPVKSSRSTVATMADLEPYLAALFLREARPVCGNDGTEAEPFDATRAAQLVADTLGSERTVLTYPVRVTGPEAYLELRERLLVDGYRRLWLDGKAVDVDTVKPSDALSAPDVEVVVDRFNANVGSRVATAVETAWQRNGAGTARAHGGGKSVTLAAGLACKECGQRFEPAQPGLFSYESPVGACGACRGFGRVIGIDLEKVIPDPRKSLAKGAIRPWSGKSTSWERAELAKLAERHGLPLSVPWNQLTAAQQALVLDGDGSWEKGLFPGVRGWFKWLETRAYKMHVRVLLARYRSYDPCPTCQGRRLGPASLRYRVAGKDLAEWHGLEVRQALTLLDGLESRTAQGALVVRELSTRLRYLERVGLGYLTLDRQARTLSGGEAQRVTLTAALGTSLHGALFVLDEPTVGLHPTDVAGLATLIRELADRNNTVLVVEHDPTLIAAADRVIELGPGAGRDGGSIVADGTPYQLAKGNGATARALRAASDVGPRPRREPRGSIAVRGATSHNLRDIDVDFPLGVLCAVTGPSGSGKSTLVRDIVYRVLARRFGAVDVETPGPHRELTVDGTLKHVVLVDQSPLGRTSRGNAATYTKAWDSIRKRFAAEPAAAARQLEASAFSFNVAGGRCEACNGEGYETVEMQFLADVRLLCPTCQGKRFSDPVLTVKHRGHTVAELLESTVEATLDLFRDDPAIIRALGPLVKLGLGYLRLGQPLSTLSGGEAQRLKLARVLGETHARTLFVLDEPSAGLHADEVRSVVEALDLVVDGGGSVLVVEHDVALVRAADWVIDLGPGSGVEGGSLVACGRPEEVERGSGRTAQALREAQVPLKKAKARASSKAPQVLHVDTAREHNLRGVSVSIPHGSLTVVTGPSGSGKSTLAFDVIFAEGQRRFLETLTPYARQFLPKLPRPDVGSVTGVPPSIALEQRTSRAGPRSTVATVTEVAHYLRLMFAKLGEPHCPDHGVPVRRTPVEVVLAQLREQSRSAQLLAPAVESRKGKYQDVFTAAAKAGIELAYVDGKMVPIEPAPKLAKTKEHTIELVIADAIEPRLIDRGLLEEALRWGKGTVLLRRGDKTSRHSTTGSCPHCGFAAPTLDPRWFSFNTKQGQCETCEGVGVVERTKTVKVGRKKETVTEHVPCDDCGGTRLAPIPRAVRLAGAGYSDIATLSVDAALAWAQELLLEGDAALVGEPVRRELLRRLAFLVDVGLSYLSLDRAAATLSGGEMQRLRLSAQLGAGLTGALYVLDEPTIGLHPRDTTRLLTNLRKLVELGSTVLVVEHDVETIRAADWLVDMGPRGGSGGGHVVASGVPKVVLADAASPTGIALREPTLRRQRKDVTDSPRLELLGASEHNLVDVDLRLPLGAFVVVAGVSGSGKSTLIRQVLLPAVRKTLGLVSEPAGAHREVRGIGPLLRALSVDQSPIGRTPRSVPATFLGIFDELRRLFAASPDAKVAGFDASRFSFNTPRGGRCTGCDGQGVVTHEMSFLPDVTTPCPSCNGLRFEPRTLDIRYLGLSIGEALLLTAEQACDVFKAHPSIIAPLRTLVDLGAGYLTLGQGSHTLSGGEAQRVKLAAELTASRRHEPTLYVLDEPTTGLHVGDVGKLLTVLSRLVERGDTLVVIEHHPELIAGADWLIELGPEGGRGGGRIVAEGTPETVAKLDTATAAVVRAELRLGERPKASSRAKR